MTTIAQARQALEALAAYKTIDGAPTPEQTAAMRQWTGWGPLAPAFAKNPDGSWGDISDALDTIFANDPAALTAAAELLDTSFYTSPDIIDAVYNILRETGFRSGTAFEPGCGSGRFISQTPADMDIEWTGIDADPTSAGIAAALNPAATIIAKPLQKAPLATGRFDIAIGNVPFSSAHVFDPAYDTAPLHEYFLLRAIDAVRDGGYVIAVTSRFTMDSASGMNKIAKRADIMGAVRLPSGAFAEVGTNVATDIVVLRKRAEGAKTVGWNDREENAATYNPNGYPNKYTSNRLKITAKINEEKYAAPVEVNNYWRIRPEHCAGVMKATGNIHNALAVLSDDHTRDITAAVTALLPYIAPIAAVVPETESLDDVPLTDAEGRKEGSFHVIEGQIHEVRGGALNPVRANKELFALISLRDAALHLLDLEADPDLDEDTITPVRKTAHTLYAQYVKAHGPLNRGNLHEGPNDPETGLPAYSWRRPPMGGFRRDPDYVTVMAIEEYDQESGNAKAAPILLRRVNHRPKPATYAATPGEALSISMGEGRGVDLNRVGQLINSPNTATTIDLLGDLIYRNPANGRQELARDYLSGNVREKLQTALEAASREASYERNVTALQAVVPEDLGPLEIRASLGAPWIDPSDVVDFSKQILGYPVQIKHTAAVATWEVEHKYARCTMQVALDWGTSRMNPFRLLQCGLNGETPTIFDEVPNERGGVSKVRNVEETLAAEDKLKALQERFSTWVWEDEARSKRICEKFNALFNSHVARRNDGSHLTFPGMAEGIELWQWQKDIVDRIVSSERVLCGHAVGSGKTKSMIASAMTLRRFGLARKPLIAVPNHLLEQIAREAQQAYPTGRFLIASKEDLAGDSRRLFAARCATGDWDAVILTHNAFTSLAVDPEREIRWIEDQKAELRGHLQDIGDDRSMGAKRIAKALRAFEARVEALRHSTGDTKQVRFDQLGVDFIAADEAQAFKRLQIATRAEGFSLGASKRATDLLLKIDVLADMHPGKPIVALFTGTPWSNTLAETFVWQKYLQPDRLALAQVDQFDAWAAVFVRYETKIEVTPDGGGFRMYRRPSVIQNFPELRGMLGEVADLLPADAINLQRPDHQATTLTVKATREQRAYVMSLSKRADDLRSGAKNITENGKQDNMLLICGDGRKMALDPTLVNLPGESPKVEAIAQNVAKIYHETKDQPYGDSPTPGALQVVFSDIGTPRPGDTQTYGRLRARIVELGVPAERIRWIHEAKTDKAKSALFSACRDGSVSVLLGSTEKMGTGTNIQLRLRTLHHMDAPWRPSDIEQREGRGLRPGNLNPFVDIFRYVTVGSFDAFMWSALERKQRFISQIYRADSTVREIEDVSDVVLNFGQVKALAAGNPKLLEQASLNSEVRRLKMLRSVHQQSVNAAQKRATTAISEAEAIDSAVKLWTRAQAVLEMFKDATPTEYPTDQTSSLQQMENFITDMLQDRPWRVNYKGLRLLAVTSGKERETHRQVQILLDSLRIGTVSLPNRTLRRKPGVALAALLEEVEVWVADLPARIERGKHEIVRRRQEAEEASRVRETAVFAGAEALAEAERQLAEVENAIEAAAVPTSLAPEQVPQAA